MRRALIEARKNAGLSQQAVAAAVGISRSFYTLIENGARSPSLPVALRIAGLLGAEPGGLFAPSSLPSAGDDGSGSAEGDKAGAVRRR